MTKRPVAPPVSGLEEEYAFIRELERGERSVTWLAREVALGRDVAVKLLRPEHRDDEAAAAELAREGVLSGMY